jgi:outer membrane lipopolysaccharide assembly protein LptE/RlpB
MSRVGPRAAVALLLSAGAAILLAGGCGYSMAAGTGRLPSGAEKIHVAPLENRTPDAEAGVLVAAALRQELARRGADGGPGSPARLEGTVVRAVFAPTTPQVASYRLTLEVQARLVVDGKPVAEQTVRREQDYLGEEDALASEGRRRNALRAAATEVAREIVERLETP